MVEFQLKVNPHYIISEYHIGLWWLTMAHGGSRWLTVVDPVPNKVDPVVRVWLTVGSRWLTVNSPELKQPVKI